MQFSEIAIINRTSAPESIGGYWKIYLNIVGDVKRVSLTNGKRQVGQVELLLGRHWMVKECIDGRIVYVTESVQRSAGKVELQGEWCIRTQISVWVSVAMLFRGVRAADYELWSQLDVASLALSKDGWGREESFLGAIRNLVISVLKIQAQKTTQSLMWFKTHTKRKCTVYQYILDNI